MQVEDLQTNPASLLSPQDRRRSAREMRRLEGWLGDARDGVMTQQQRVDITHLSMHGVGFTAPKLLEGGAAHWIVVANDRLHLSTRVRVVTVRPCGDGTCDVGAEFF
jgi:hypothetical protein